MAKINKTCNTRLRTFFKRRARMAAALRSVDIKTKPELIKKFSGFNFRKLLSKKEQL